MEDVYASTGTKCWHWARLTRTQTPLIGKTADKNEKPIDEGMPPRKTREPRTGGTVLTPLINRAKDATDIEALNPTDRTPPGTNH
jgi:hypothetical protein